MQTRVQEAVKHSPALTFKLSKARELKSVQVNQRISLQQRNHLQASQLFLAEEFRSEEIELENKLQTLDF